MKNKNAKNVFRISSDAKNEKMKSNFSSLIEGNMAVLMV